MGAFQLPWSAYETQNYIPHVRTFGQIVNALEFSFKNMLRTHGCKYSSFHVVPKLVMILTDNVRHIILVQERDELWTRITKNHNAITGLLVVNRCMVLGFW